MRSHRALQTLGKPCCLQPAAVPLTEACPRAEPRLRVGSPKAQVWVGAAVPSPTGVGVREHRQACRAEAEGVTVLSADLGKPGVDRDFGEWGQGPGPAPGPGKAYRPAGLCMKAGPRGQARLTAVSLADVESRAGIPGGGRATHSEPATPKQERPPPDDVPPGSPSAAGPDRAALDEPLSSDIRSEGAGTSWRRCGVGQPLGSLVRAWAVAPSGDRPPRHSHGPARAPPYSATRLG